MPKELKILIIAVALGIPCFCVYVTATDPYTNRYDSPLITFLNGIVGLLIGFFVDTGLCLLVIVLDFLLKWLREK